jgi:hypothetical protein
MSVEMHEAALFTFGYVFGRVRPTEEIVATMVTSQAAYAGRG